MNRRPRHPFQRLIRPATAFIRFRILHVDDSASSIAGGVAVGLFMGFTPLLGLHMLLALAAAAMLRVNKAVAVLCVWISNPFTLLPIYVPAYMIGRALLGRFRPASVAVQTEQIHDILKVFSPVNLLTRFHTAAFWKELASVFAKIGLEITIGGFILGALAASIGYFVSLVLIRAYRAKKGIRRFRRHR